MRKNHSADILITKEENMLYKKNSSEHLPDELFRNPTSEYRGTPFWAWNTELDKDELMRQIEIFRKMGFGGFHMHVRTGMSTKYLSDDFMALIKSCVDKAKAENMLAWLYDEDRWSSGAAAGTITKAHKFRQTEVVFTSSPEKVREEYFKECGDDYEDGDVVVLAVYDIRFDDDYRMISYSRVSDDMPISGERKYAVRLRETASTWFNGGTHVDSMNTEAIAEFIRVTHERYKETVGNEFDKTVPAIFTDEPQVSRFRAFNDPSDKSDYASIQWTDRFPEEYKARFGSDILDCLPEIVLDFSDRRASIHRYRYHDLVTEMFVNAFARQIGSWCDRNNISLTGHLMDEPSLGSQTNFVGETMRSYGGFGLPGIDMLCASFEFTTAKQCQSAVHQYGKEGMTSELYGVTGWDFDFRGHKLHGDWQACMGVTVRVPHLSWVAMGGEAKRDYPASISYQSPWWEEYSFVEDHFARINTLMTRGKPIVKIGVIHPVESYWCLYGPVSQNKRSLNELENRFKSVTEWLIKSSIDFDYICESTLPELCEEGSAPFKVGKMCYDTVIVPGCVSLRSSTVERLEKFVSEGGRLIFIGDAPSICDGADSDRCKEIYDKAEKIAFDKAALIDTLDKDRTVSIRNNDGSLSSEFIYQLREEEDGLNLFICRDCEPLSKNEVHESKLTIGIKGEYSPVEYNTITGEIYALPCQYENGFTLISKTLYDYDSLLLKLKKGRSCLIDSPVAKVTGKAVPLPSEVEYELSEKNVFLIDMCEFALDGAEFSPSEEILRLDNICRERLGLPHRGGSVAQPWTMPKEIMTHTITLRRTFRSEISVKGAFLALEKAEAAEIVFNGKEIPSEVSGWFTDKDIKTVALPEIREGENTLTVTLPFGKTSNTEWMYILGDFAVRFKDGAPVLCGLPEKLSFGSITNQGFPFYGGNIGYKFETDVCDGLKLKATHYTGALIGVEIDGERKGRIVYPPYEFEISGLPLKKHSITLTLFGNRENCFGPVHRNESGGWIGPNAWRTENEKWTYGYNLKDIGITEKPVLEVK